MYRKAFLESAYYKGLKIYLDFVHDPKGTCERGEVGKLQHFERFKNEEGEIIGNPKQQALIQKAIDYPPLDTADASRFETWGVIIYTDERTRDILETLFPYEDYPKMVLAVVEWPFYATKTGRCEPTIMRCMRYQAMELFQTQTICVRDADTLFVDLLERQYPTDELNVPMTNEIRRIQERLAQIRDYATYMVLWWESEFLKSWRSEYEKLITFSDMYLYSMLVIGSSLQYAKDWHTNIPFEVPISKKVNSRMFKYMIQKKTQRALSYASKLGLYAGFVNVSRRRNETIYAPVMKRLWQDCVEYLQSRYFMAGPDRIISDSFCRDLAGADVGKDERLLLFVFTRDQDVRMLTTYYNIEYVPTERPRVALTEWPLSVAGVGYTFPTFDHICTPYYNSEIMRATVQISLQEYLNERHRAIQEQYASFITTYDKPAMEALMRESTAKCNPWVQKEDLFLEKADVRPIEYESRGILGGGRKRKSRKRRGRTKKQTRRRRT